MSNIFPISIQNLINHFKTLPDIGHKTAERLVFYLLRRSKDNIKEFAEALNKIASEIKLCEICYNFCEDNDKKEPALAPAGATAGLRNICSICAHPKRDKTVICAVASPQDLHALERTSEFKGVYHILGGLIDQINNIHPENLNIKSLIQRIKSPNPKIQEVILAFNPTIEGESTTLYLIRLLKKYNIMISRLARGLPMGADLNYADEITLTQALQNRAQI